MHHWSASIAQIFQAECQPIELRWWFYGSGICYPANARVTITDGLGATLFQKVYEIAGDCPGHYEGEVDEYLPGGQWVEVTTEPLTWSEGPLTVMFEYYECNTYIGIDDVEVFPQRGDVNADGVINSADIVYLINYLFVAGSPAPDPLWIGDCNSDEVIDSADVVYLINFLFVPGSPPPGC